MPGLRSILKAIDWTVIVAILILMTIGVLFIYSSGITSTGDLVSREYIKQMMWAGTGILLLIITVFFDLKRLSDYLPTVYMLMLGLLVYTKLFGKVVNGARSWLGLIGDYGIQPSEFMKVATVLFLARYLERSAHEPSSFKRFALSFGIVALPMGLILVQPDFGTALVFIPLYLAMSYIGGINRRYLVFMILAGGISIVLTVMPLWQKLIAANPSIVMRIFYEEPYVFYAVGVMAFALLIALAGYRLSKKKYYYWVSYGIFIVLLGLLVSMAGQRVLKEYQIMRLVVFLDPSIDPLGSGWNILQSITAIGSGGLTGKGYLQGTQSHYRYLPQQSTDFIFSIVSEELGFIGGLLIFALFLYIMIRLLLIIRNVRSLFSATLVAGIVAIILFHFMINVGMAMGVMPITGIPLLFLSYGGSALWSISIGVGMCIGIGARKFEQ